MPRSLRWWFVPAQCGDFRLESTGASTCRLTIVDPTSADEARLTPFFAAVAKLDRAWWEKLLGLAGTPKGYAPTGETVLDFERPITELGPLLAGATARPNPLGVWTAIRHENGVFLADGVTLVEDKVPEPVAAATVSAPRRGCPAPTAAARRASEVLRAFCTARQFAQYQAEGRMRVLGNQTGKAYYVHHRDEAFARGLSRCVTEAATGRVLCAWDDQVPPEEETLALKLALEHREGDYSGFLLL